MTARHLPLLLLALLPLLSLPARAIDPPVRRVTVVGTATIKLVPDQMEWSVQVSINDATLAKAKTRHDGSLTDAVKFLKAQGGALKDLQTGGLNIQKNSYAPPDSELARRPYTCSTQVTFTLTDFNRYGAIADGLAKLDGLQVQGVNYSSSKAEATAREAAKQALLNAHDRANDLAVTAGCYIDKPLEIQAGGGDGPRPMFAPRLAMAMAKDVGTPDPVAGQIEVSASVTVTYDLFYK